MSKKKCRVGFGCGLTCISRTKRCEDVHSTSTKVSVNGFTSFVKRVIEFGNTPVGELIGGKKVPVESNKQLLNKTLAEGKEKTDQMLDPELMKAAIDNYAAREAFKKKKIDTLAKIVKAQRNAKTEEEKLKVNKDFVELIDSYYDDVHWLDDQIEGIPLRKDLDREARREQWEKLREERDAALNQTPEGKLMQSFKDNLMGNVTLGEEEVEDSLVFESTGGYNDLGAEVEATYTKAYTDAKTLSGLYTGAEFIQTGNYVGEERAYAIPYNSELSDPNLEKPESANLRGAEREAKIVELSESYEGGEIEVGVAYTDLERTINMYHEYGHHVEGRHMDIADMNMRWLESRSKTKKPEWLGKITGIRGYDRSEVAYRDNFISPYVGKVYQKPESFNIASEVFSMGFENFASPGGMLDLYLKDREHFDLIVGTILEVQRRGNADRDNV